MDSRDPGKDRDIIPINSRRSVDPLAGGRIDPRSGESALAREFAQRALMPLVANLRNRQGRLEAGRVARALGMTGARFAECLDLPIDVLSQSPPPPELEARLEPFAMVIGIVRDVYGGDDKRVRLWLRTARPELDGRTPNDALCVPAGIQTVIHFVLGAWLGNAD
ncbi:MAG: antitoxin Xre/MbcA/ParS toxin-binding domain-containing protein [Gemmatimonadaceae bacterium]